MQNTIKRDFFPPLTKVFKLPNDFSFDANKIKQQTPIKIRNQINVTNSNQEKNKTKNERTNDKLNKTFPRPSIITDDNNVLLNFCEIINISETTKSQLRDRSFLNQRIYLNKSNLGMNQTKNEEKHKNLRNTSMNIRQNFSPIRLEAKELIKIYKPNSNFRIKSSSKERSTRNSVYKPTNHNDQKLDQTISFGNPEIFRHALENQKNGQNINIIGNINYENINLNFTFSKEDMDTVGLKDLKNIENSVLKDLCAEVLEKECTNFKRKGKQEAKKITFVKETDQFFISFDDYDFHEIIDNNTEIIEPEINDILRQTPNFEVMEKYMNELKFQSSNDPSTSNNDNKQTTISENPSNIFSNEFLLTNQDSEENISLTNNINKILKMDIPEKKFLEKKEIPSQATKVQNSQNIPNTNIKIDLLIKEFRKDSIKEKYNNNGSNKSVIKNTIANNRKESFHFKKKENENQADPKKIDKIDSKKKYPEKNCLLIQFDTDEEDEINLNNKDEKEIWKCEKNLISKKIDLIDLNNL